MLALLMAQGAVNRPGPGRPKRRPHRLVGDTADSSRAIRQYVRRRGMRTTMPRKVTERRTGPFQRALYRLRSQVEWRINRLKPRRRVATRYEKRAANYSAMICLAAIMRWL
jgi:transposase